MNVHIRRTKWVSSSCGPVNPVAWAKLLTRDRFDFLMLEPTETSLGCYRFNKTLMGEIQWLETSTIKQRSTTRTPPNLIGPRPNIMAKAITQRAKSIQQTPSNIRKMLANTANKRMPRVSSKSERRGPIGVGPLLS
jgi:hypothetical protein